MFPAVLVEPAMTLTTYWIASFVLLFGYLLRYYLKIIFLIAFVFILLLTPISSSALMGNPWGCGSTCRMNWGRTSYPGAYWYPMNINPYAFYQSPFTYFQMLPPWFGSVPYYSPIFRGVQSVDQKDSLLTD